MKEEIKGPKVKGVYVCLLPEKGEDNATVYNVYLLNDTEEELEQVIVNSRGYTSIKNTTEKKTTNTLRKMLGNIPPKKFQKIEPIMDEVLKLDNEYWVSYWKGETMYDKKFVFLAEGIKEENFVTLPLLQKKGILVGKEE